jgi:hypothetical protein
MNEYEKLIPELTEWKKRNGSQFNIETWTEIEGNIKLAIGYSNLFWPDFIEHDNCIFLKSHFSIDNFELWENTASNKNYAQIESIMNHIHIVDLFATLAPPSRQSIYNKLFNRAVYRQEKITKEQVIFLGNKLLEIYSAKLSIDYPEKRFDISFDFIDNPDNIEDYQLTFCQSDNESRKTKYGS